MRGTVSVDGKSSCPARRSDLAGGVLVALTFFVGGCWSDPPPATTTPPELTPNDGRAMGVARLDYEKCDAIFEEITRSWSQRWLSTQAETLAKRLGAPDGQRADGDRYWLAVNRMGDCYELVVSTDGSYGQMSLLPEDCGLPKRTVHPRGGQRKTPAGR